MIILEYIILFIIVIGLYECVKTYLERKRMPYRYQCTQGDCYFEVTGTEASTVAELADIHRRTSHGDQA